MQPKPGRQRWPAWLAVSASSALLLLAASQPGRAQEAEPNALVPRLYLPFLTYFTASDLSSTGSTIHAQVFPPQPPGITDVVWLDDNTSPAIEAAAAAEQQATAVAAAATAVQAVLGDRYTFIGAALAEDKTGVAATTTQVTYFSHEHNSTIEVTVQAGQIQAIHQIEPDEYQPDLAQAEVDEAIALARDYFIEQGVSAVLPLTGYGILAYQPTGESGFFAQRVVYVSFHAHVDAPPQYLAWVDLTNQRILKSQEG